MRSRITRYHSPSQQCCTHIFPWFQWRGHQVFLITSTTLFTLSLNMIILIISLRVATYSNVLLNEPELGSHSSSSESSPSLLQRSTFIAGDWNEINNLLMVPHVPPLAPTLILGSETVYRTENFRPQKLLLQLLIGKNGLHPEGSALFSGRGYYFGVGGGINAFRVFLETNRIRPRSVIHSSCWIPIPRWSIWCWNCLDVSIRRFFHHKSDSSYIIIYFLIITLNFSCFPIDLILLILSRSMIRNGETDLDPTFFVRIIGDELFQIIQTQVQLASFHCWLSSKNSRAYLLV